MLVALQILNAILILTAGILLASRIYPSLFESSDVTGHDYIKDLELISRELSQKELQDPDTEFLKQRTVRAISLISENLVDSKVIATDTSTRTRLGLILLATGTFIQSLLLRRADRDDSKDFEHRLGQQKLEQQIKQLIDNIEDQPT